MTGIFENLRHLIRRFFTSLSRRPPAISDVTWVNENLLAGEFTLWLSMKSYDQRHSIEVARRFAYLCPAFTRDQVAAALLHDVGKVESELGVAGRVIATVVGPKGSKFRRYHDHEIIGLKLCREIGSSSETVRLLNWSDDSSRDNQIVSLLKQADQI